MHVVITVNERQARVLLNALDLYSRIKIGQFNEIGWLFRGRRKFDIDLVNNLLAITRHEIFPELEPNASYGIFQEEAGDGREAWDIQQVVRYALAWHNHPEGGITVDFHTPMQASDEPLPTAKVCDQPDNELKMHNPVTGTDHDVCDRTPKTGTNAKIKGAWSRENKNQ